MYADVLDSGRGGPVVVPGPVALALLGAGLGYLGTRASNAAAAREAQKNRDFQREMSDSAHSREVADLRRAGLNPILSSSRGASTPGGAQAEVRDVGEGVQRGIASALAVKQAEANIALTEAQAFESRTRSGDLISLANSGRYVEQSARAALADLSVSEKRQMIPIAIERARAELLATVADARRANAAAMLDELAKTGRMNMEEFEREFGEAGPRLRFLFELLRSIR